MLQTSSHLKKNYNLSSHSNQTSSQSSSFFLSERSNWHQVSSTSHKIFRSTGVCCSSSFRVYCTYKVSVSLGCGCWRPVDERKHPKCLREFSVPSCEFRDMQPWRLNFDCLNFPNIGATNFLSRQLKWVVETPARQKTHTKKKHDHDNYLKTGPNLLIVIFF